MTPLRLLFIAMLCIVGLASCGPNLPYDTEIIDSPKPYDESRRYLARGPIPSDHPVEASEHQWWLALGAKMCAEFGERGEGMTLFLDKESGAVTQWMPSCSTTKET